MPSKSGTPALSLRMRFLRISSLTEIDWYPEDLSSPRVWGWVMKALYKPQDERSDSWRWPKRHMGTQGRQAMPPLLAHAAIFSATSDVRRARSCHDRSVWTRVSAGDSNSSC